MTKLFFCYLSLILVIVLAPAQVFAISAPVLLGPINDVTVDNSTLSWQAVSDANPTEAYRVQVSWTNDFAILKKDYTTDKTTYKPSLDNGQWYWRVKAKDNTDDWSQWSTPASFILGEIEATPLPSVDSAPSPSPSTSASPLVSPTPIVTNTPLPTVAATPIPTPTPTPTPSPTATAISNKLIYTNLPASINSDQSINVSVELMGMTANSQYYLKPVFYKSGSSNYFGKTLVSSNWIKNSTTLNEQFNVTTNNNGYWQGQISFIADIDDSGFSGSGDYLFKIGRYTASGNGPTWSQESAINITLIVVATPSPSPSNQPLSSAPPIGGLSSATDASDLSEEINTNTTIDPDLVDLPSLSAPSVLGEATSSSDLVLTTKVLPWNWYIIGGVASLITALGYIFYRYYQEKIIDAISQFRSYIDSTDRPRL